MDKLEKKLNLPFVTSTNPRGHPSRTLHKNNTGVWSGIHNPHKEKMIGTFFEIEEVNDRMKRVKSKNNMKNYATVNIPPGKTLVFKGQNIFHRAPNSIRKNAPKLFQTNDFNNIATSIIQQKPRRKFVVSTI